MTYFYLKHAQRPQKYTLEQVLSQESTAQNGQKVLKITKIHYVPVVLSRLSPGKRPLMRPQNPF